MKIFTLIVTLLFAATGYSQDFGGTPPNCTLPAGYTISQGDRMITYQNPLKGCADDCGVLTPGVGGNNPGNMIYPSGQMGIAVDVTNGTSLYFLSVRFNVFAFDANGKCTSDKDFQCPLFVTLYIVDSSYNSVQAPTQYYGKSKPFLLRAHGAENALSVAFDITPDLTKKYRVFLDFGQGTTCIQQSTKYVLDILPSGGPLPVNVSSFLVARTGSSVSLNWKTEIELNALNFEVQRSYDNTSYKTIGTVRGIVSSASTKNYSYTDNSNTSTSLSFYRIKIVKQSGEISYSDIKTVKGLANKAGFVIFPNPAISNAKITISDVSEVTRVQLLDNSGRIVKSIMLNNTNTVELNGLQKGAYLVKIIGSISGHTEIRKLTILN